MLMRDGMIGVLDRKKKKRRRGRSGDDEGCCGVCD